MARTRPNFTVSRDGVPRATLKASVRLSRYEYDQLEAFVSKHFKRQTVSERADSVFADGIFRMIEEANEETEIGNDFDDDSPDTPSLSDEAMIELCTRVGKDLLDRKGHRFD